MQFSRRRTYFAGSSAGLSSRPCRSRQRAPLQPGVPPWAFGFGGSWLGRFATHTQARLTNKAKIENRFMFTSLSLVEMPATERLRTILSAQIHPLRGKPRPTYSRYFPQLQESLRTALFLIGRGFGSGIGFCARCRSLQGCFHLSWASSLMSAAASRPAASAARPPARAASAASWPAFFISSVALLHFVRHHWVFTARRQTRLKPHRAINICFLIAIPSFANCQGNWLISRGDSRLPQGKSRSRAAQNACGLSNKIDPPDWVLFPRRYTFLGAARGIIRSLPNS